MRKSLKFSVYEFMKVYDFFDDEAIIDIFLVLLISYNYTIYSCNSKLYYKALQNETHYNKEQNISDIIKARF